MSFPQLLADYGYIGLFAGSLLEGETVLVLAGFAAHQGHLSLPWVVAVAFCGGTLGDQIFFFVGRRYGESLLRHLPRLARNAERVNRLLLRHHAGLIIGVRFMYGFRIIGPIVIGMSRVSAGRFLLFNLLGAAIWSVAIAGVGFFFGHALQWLLIDFGRFEWVGALVIVGVACLIAVAHRICAASR